MESEECKKYLAAKLSDIMDSLNRDIAQNQLKHQQDLQQLRTVIEDKDREIEELRQQVAQLQEKAKPTPNPTSTPTLKRITLQRKNHPVSHFNPTEREQTLREIQIDANLDAKESKPTALPVKLKPPIPKKYSLDTHPLVQSLEINDKENYKSIEPPRISYATPTNAVHRRQRSTTAIAKSQTQPLKIQTDRKESVPKPTAAEKKCINVVIPVRNFSALTLRPAKAELSLL
jgi:hypothetical protein